MRRYKKNKNIFHEKGFSMVEVMVAIFLVTTGLIAAVYLMNDNLVETLSSRNQIIATMLAQEGVELVRNLRDDSWAGGGDAFDHMGSSSNYCRIDKNSNDLNCSGGRPYSDYRMYLDGNGYYIHGSGTATGFYRHILSVMDGGDTATRVVTSLVTWGNNDITSISDCTIINKCVYVKVTLNSWNNN